MQSEGNAPPPNVRGLNRPDVGLQRAVQPFVKRSGGEVAAPVVVVSVCVCEEISTEYRKSRPSHVHASLFTQNLKVI